MFQRRNPQQPNFGPEQKNMTIQPKQQTSIKWKYICHLATFSSFLCSIVAVSLLAGNLFGPKTIFDKKIGEAYDHVHGLLVASVLLGIAAMVLSPPKCDSKEVSTAASPYNSIADSKRNEKYPSTKFEKANKKSFKLMENVKTNAFKSKSKAETRDVPSKVEETFKISEHTALPQPYSNIPSTNSPHGGSSTSYSSKAVLPYDENRNPLINKKHGKAPLFYNSMFPETSNRVLAHHLNTTNMLRNNTVTEYIASRRMRYTAGGNVQRQEEFKIKRITNVFRCPETGLPTYGLQETNLKRSNEEYRRKFSSSPDVSFQKDHVSEMITKMESLQFYC